MQNLIMLFFHMELDKKMQTSAYILRLVETVIIVCLYVDDILILNDYMA